MLNVLRTERSRLLEDFRQLIFKGKKEYFHPTAYDYIPVDICAYTFATDVHVLRMLLSVPFDVCRSVMRSSA